MARFSELDRDLIDEAAQEWRENCLVADGALLFEGDVWTSDNLAELHRRLIDQYIGGTDQDFFEKLEVQLEGAGDVARLAAECILVYCLFAWTGMLSPEWKREMVRRALRYGGVDPGEINEESVAWKALDEGIGNPGGRYNMRRHDELSYIIELARLFKELEEKRQSELMGKEPWAFQEWVDSQEELEGSAQSRHILLHLLWPDHYERMASGGHKHRITRTYSGLLDAEAGDQDLDQQLLAIRRTLAEKLKIADADLDFYGTEGVNGWWVGDPEDQDALRHKGQLVFYGPPGTSKTYDAEELAEGLIRSEAIARWGIEQYLQRHDELPDLIKTHRHYLQLHPAYSYEEFIGGLQLTEGGGTSYVPGFLPRLCQRIESEQEAEKGEGLPHVLILDELNRADLSRVFGEAFSRLELSQRDRPVILTGGDPQSDEPPTLTIPADLFVIGTMNLIDQSVEQLDFALRRRFLWRPSRFSRDRLLEVLGEMWRAENDRSVDWSRLESDMEAFAQAAENLNEKIADLDLLGPQYEVGHAYFFDVIPILADGIASSRQQVFLWGRSTAKAPTASLQRFWEMVLEPLLGEYLAGLEQGTRERYTEELRTAFLTRP